MKKLFEIIYQIIIVGLIFAVIIISAISNNTIGILSGIILYLLWNIQLIKLN